MKTFNDYEKLVKEATTVKELVELYSEYSKNEIEVENRIKEINEEITQLVKERDSLNFQGVYPLENNILFYIGKLIVEDNIPNKA